MKKKFLAALAAFALITPSAQAASDYLLELDGVKGESKDDTHKESIEIASFSWGASNPTAASGGGGGAGKVVFQDIHFTTSVSKASPQLLLACAQGRRIPKAKLFVRKSGSSNDYMVITLTDVLVSSYSSSSGGSTNPPGSATSSTLPQDSISINFTRVEMSYTAEDGTTTTGAAGDPQ